MGIEENFIWEWIINCPQCSLDQSSQQQDWFTSKAIWLAVWIFVGTFQKGGPMCSHTSHNYYAGPDGYLLLDIFRPL